MLIFLVFVFLLSCSSKSKVVYIKKEPEGVKTKVIEKCESDGTDEYCEKIVIKVIKSKKETLYEKTKKETITELLKNPPAPVKAPDKILRILILPWTDKDGNLHAMKYIFVKVEEGQWILGNYLIFPEKRKFVNPLEVQND